MTDTKTLWSSEKQWVAGANTEDGLIDWYARTEGGVFLTEWPVARGAPWPTGTKPRRIDALRVTTPEIGVTGVWKSIDSPTLLGPHPTLEVIEAKKKLSQHGSPRPTFHSMS